MVGVPAFLTEYFLVCSQGVILSEFAWSIAPDDMSRTKYQCSN